MRQLPESPLQMLLRAWPPRLNLFFLRDLIVNVALYVPVGMSAHFAFRKWPLRFFDLYAPVVLGLLLSTSVELMQLYEPLRNASIVDIATNVIGAMLGVFLAVAFETFAEGTPASTVHRGVTDPAALALVFTGAAYLLFPFLPVLGRYALAPKLNAFAEAPVFDLMQFVSGTAFWYAGGLLLKAARIRPARVWLGLSLLAIPAQFLIVARQPVPSWAIGAATGALIFAWRARKAPVHKIEAIAFLFVIVVRGFWPFHFIAAPNGFTWIPFGGFLGDDWQVGILVLLEKVFYYGVSIWLLRASGTRLWQAMTIVAVVLACIEFAQIHLPGRTAEITDPILALLIAGGIAILSRETETRFRSTG
jgi:VanZ family protein